jgi:hypothetical protein
MHDKQPLDATKFALSWIAASVARISEATSGAGPQN